MTHVAPRAEATVHPYGRSKPVAMRTVFLLACGSLAACTASADEVRPPEDQIFFPTGMAVAPGESILFVANANSELRYDSGSIAVIDLAAVDQVVADWTSSSKTIPDKCNQDPDHIETLQCTDQTRFLVQGAGARIGNFATDVAVQDNFDGTLRLIVPTRGDPSVTWIDWDGSKLSCKTGQEGFALCDEAHRLTYVHDNPDLAVLPDEPFSAFADSHGEFAVVTHLTTGAVTLIDSPAHADARISDVVRDSFAADPLTGLRGSTGVAGRSPGSTGDIVYVGSRSENRIQTFTIGTPANYPFANKYLISGNWFFLDTAGGTSGTSSDTRGMTFSPSGDRLYLLNRQPPTLQVYDTSLGVTGFPRNKGLGATDICRQASTVAVMDSGDGERAYVTCFQDGELYVIDPRLGVVVEDTIQVGRGPYAVAVSPMRKKVYVTNFLEQTIAVVDVSIQSPLRNRVVLRIGEPVVVRK